MKMNLISIFSILVIIIAGCGAQQEDVDPALDPVEVNVILEEDIVINQPTTIKTRVTQGEEVVDDADEVIFELWLDGQEVHEKIDGMPQRDGIYSIDKTFDQPGTYYVIPHVTARQMHVMPKDQFQVKEN